MSCHYKPLDGFLTRLNQNTCSKAIWLDLEDDLIDLLPEYNDWTHLAIIDGRVLEIVRAENYCGRVLFYRGQEQTTPQCFACNTIVKFTLTKSGIEAMACCPKLFE